MSEKKMISRNFAIGLGIICTVLLSSLVVTSTFYTRVVTDRNNTISQLNSDITNLQDLSNSLNSTVNDLNNIVNLKKTEVWSGGEVKQYSASSYNEWTSNPAYAGYILVYVDSNTTSTHVQVFYYSHGVNYDNQVVVGGGQTFTYFPVLPTDRITVGVGNTNSFDGALIGVFIKYYY